MVCGPESWGEEGVAPITGGVGLGARGGDTIAWKCGAYLNETGGGAAASTAKPRPTKEAAAEMPETPTEEEEAAAVASANAEEGSSTGCSGISGSGVGGGHANHADAEPNDTDADDDRGAGPSGMSPNLRSLFTFLREYANYFYDEQVRAIAAAAAGAAPSAEDDDDDRPVSVSTGGAMASFRHFAQGVKPRLDRLCANDFGLAPDEADALIGTGSNVGYLEVYSGPELTLCVFLLRKGAVIPLHDHPQMHVFGRLLFGRMRLISYSPEARVRGEGAEERLRIPPGSCWASLYQNEVLGPEPTTYEIGPRKGNIHELHAIEDVAFFDVVTPPYNITAGRGCTYYAATRVGARTSSGAGKQEQERVAPPKERFLLMPTTVRGFTTHALEYHGPRYTPGAVLAFDL